MWTMIARYGRRYHLATNDYKVFCGRDSDALYMKTYVEMVDGNVTHIGEGNQHFEVINPTSICKTCLKALASPTPQNNKK